MEIFSVEKFVVRTSCPGGEVNSNDWLNRFIWGNDRADLVTVLFFVVLRIGIVPSGQSTVFIGKASVDSPCKIW